MTKFVSISRDPTSSWSQPGRLVFHPGYIWYFITLYCFLNKSYLQNRPSFRKFQSLYKQLTYSKPCSLLRTYLLFQNMATRWSCVHLFHTFPRKAERFLSLETIFKCCESFHMSCSRFMKLWNWELMMTMFYPSRHKKYSFQASSLALIWSVKMGAAYLLSWFGISVILL